MNYIAGHLFLVLDKLWMQMDNELLFGFHALKYPLEAGSVGKLKAESAKMKIVLTETIPLTRRFFCFDQFHHFVLVLSRHAM